MAYERDKALAALAAFQKFTGLKDDPWEKAASVGEGTLRRFRNGRTNSLQTATYDKLAAGASQLKGQQFTAAHIRGEIALPLAGDDVPDIDLAAGFAEASTPFAGGPALSRLAGIVERLERVADRIESAEAKRKRED